MGQWPAQYCFRIIVCKPFQILDSFDHFLYKHNNYSLVILLMDGFHSTHSPRWFDLLGFNTWLFTIFHFFSHWPFVSLFNLGNLLIKRKKNNKKKGISCWIRQALWSIFFNRSSKDITSYWIPIKKTYFYLIVLSAKVLLFRFSVFFRLCIVPMQAPLDMSCEVIFVRAKMLAYAALERSTVTMATHMQSIHHFIQKDNATVHTFCWKFILSTSINFLCFYYIQGTFIFYIWRCLRFLLGGTICSWPRSGMLDRQI